jgi:hypothetical protein
VQSFLFQLLLDDPRDHFALIVIFALSGLSFPAQVPDTRWIFALDQALVVGEVFSINQVS